MVRQIGPDFSGRERTRRPRQRATFSATPHHSASPATPPLSPVPTAHRPPPTGLPPISVGPVRTHSGAYTGVPGTGRAVPSGRGYSLFGVPAIRGVRIGDFWYPGVYGYSRGIWD